MTVPLDAPSSYLMYLPPILAAGDDAAPLGRFLKVFEKLLTGIDDREPIPGPGGGPPARPVEERIDRVPLTFDAWCTPAGMLGWLAGRVGLEFRPEWDEYQRRKLTGAIVRIYRERGLKRGLRAYLDLYAASPARPRVVIDDGEAVLRVWPGPGGGVEVSPVAYARQWPDGLGFPPVLLHPTAVAFDAPAGPTPPGLVVADAGRVAGVVEPRDRRGAVWRVSRSGELLDWAAPGAGGVPRPLSVNNPTDPKPLRRPVGVVVPAAREVIVLDRRSDESPPAGLFRYTRGADGYAQAPLLAGRQLADFGAAVAFPLDMTAAGGRLVILDRGPVVGGAYRPRLVVVPAAAGDPAAVAVFPLAAPAVAPRALLRLTDTEFLLTDARGQRLDDPPDALVGDLLTVALDPAGPPGELTPRSLLAGLPPGRNPLRQPLGVVAEEPGVYLVSDTGLKDPDFSAQSEVVRAAAEPPGLFRVDTRGGAPAVARVPLRGGLATPTRLARDPRTGATYLLEYGEADPADAEYRGAPHRFGVHLHLDAARAPAGDVAAEAVVDAVYRGVVAVVGAERPAHTVGVVRAGGVSPD